MRKILVADLLCGAGGSSTGAILALLALGYTLEQIILVCVNHWQTAIDTHTKNHPQARHYVQDIAACRPHIIVPEGRLDLLMASPTCTHHSVARGGKPTSDQQRSDPWHIITWLTELRVRCLIIENVWEFCGWGPVDPRAGKPIPSRKGEYFRAWIDTIRRLGFDPEWRKLNAADYGDATTRQRFILMARSDKRSVSWPIPTHAKKQDGSLALFPSMQPWRAAREIIDWEIKGKSIFNRKKPLAPKTLARIHAGAVKFNWPEPFLVILRNHMAGQSVDGPLPTIAAGGTHIGLAEPVMFANRTNNAAKNADEPVPCMTTSTGGGIWLAEPVIVNMKGQSTASGIDSPLPTQTSHAAHLYSAEPVIMNGRKNNQPLGVSSEPIPTLDTKGGVWLAEPFVLSQHNSGAPRSVGDPLSTITTGGAATVDHPGCARPMLVEPFVLNRHGDNGGTRAHSIAEPLPTSDCRGAGYVIAPFVLSRQGGGAPRAVDEPTPTQCAKHSHVLISPYYGSGSGETCKSAEVPLDTVTAKARFGVVVPVTHSQGGNQARELEQPLPTMTTAKGGEFAIVVPITHAGEHRARDVNSEPLSTITGAHRGELAFITAQHGERQGQAPRVHSVDDPAPTIAASGHVDLVTDGQRYDILFRMLEPHELAAAMGFTTEDQAYEFAGTKTDQIKQIGNAVSVRKMKACVGALMADASPKKKTAPAKLRKVAT